MFANFLNYPKFIPDKLKLNEIFFDNHLGGSGFFFLNFG